MTSVKFHFISPLGEPIANAPFDVQLDRSDMDEAVTGIILPRLIQATTDADGRATLELTPTSSRYHVTLIDPLTDAGLHYEFYVAELNTPGGSVQLEDLVVDPKTDIRSIAYDEELMIRLVTLKAQAAIAADVATNAAAAAQASADFADDSIQLTVDARNAAQVAAATAVGAKDTVLANSQSSHDNALLAEDRAAAALSYKQDAAASAASAAADKGLTHDFYDLAAARAGEAATSKAGADASRDAASSSAITATGAKDATIAARDITTLARDVTLAARDVTLDARDTTLVKAAQLASQLAAFNEIYIGKFAVAPTVDGNGNPLKVGAIYENTVAGKIYQWEADLAWHPYDEESQLQLNNAILSANNAAGSAAGALSSAQTAADRSAEAATNAGYANDRAVAAANSAAASLASESNALASKLDAAASKATAVNAAQTATDKAAAAAQSASDAAASAALATSGQIQADWTQTDPVHKGFIQHKPVLAAVATTGAKADIGLGNVDNTSDLAKPVSTAAATAIGLKQDANQKDAANGFPGLSGFKLALKNAAGTIVSYLTSVATVARTWNLPDKDGTIALLSDITGSNSGNNTGDETQASILAKLGATTVTGSNTGDETVGTIKSKLGIATLSGSNTGDQTAASLGLGNVNNTSDVNKPVSAAQQAALDLKANITYVDSKVAALVASAPAALDTLNELSAALGNDANFATTMTNNLASKLPLAGGNMSGSLNTRLGTPVAAITSLNGANAPIGFSMTTVPTGSASYTEMLHGTTVLNGQGYIQHISIGAYRPGNIAWGGGIFLGVGGADANVTEGFYLNYGGGISHSSGTALLYGNITGNADGAGKAWITTDETSDVTEYLTLNRGGGVYAPQYNTAKLSFNPAAGLLYSATGMTTANNGTWGRNIFFGNVPTYGPTTASVAVTDGNVHIDPATSGTHATYLNFYSGTGGVKFGNGAQGVVATVDAAGVFTGNGSGLSNVKAAKVMSTAGGSGTTFNWAGMGGTPQWVWGHAGGDPDSAYVYNPANFSVDNAAKLGTIPALSTIQRRRQFLGNGSGLGLNDAGYYNGANGSEYGFSYGSAGEAVGPYIHFGGLSAGVANNYGMQISANYGDGNIMRFRTRNDDAGVWNPWKDIFHTGNLVPPSVPATASTLMQRDGSGDTYARYMNASYLNTTDDGVGGEPGGAAVTQIITKRGDNYHRSTGKVAVKAFLGITGADVYADRSNTDSHLGVVREMAWKNYGNGHTIFDASKGITPTGAACNNTNPDNDWSATYPTLMGYNGNNTYGVRVARARLAEGVVGGIVGNVGGNGIGYGSYGSVNIGGQAGGYGGFSFSDFNSTLMWNRTYQGSYIDNSVWQWRFTNGVLDVGSVPGSSVTGTVNQASNAVLVNGQAFTTGDGWWRSTGNTGWYNSSYGTGIYSTEGGTIRTYNNARIVSGNGSAGLPSFSFAQDTDTGFFSPQDGVLGIAVNAQYIGYFSGNSLAMYGDITAFSDPRLKKDWTGLPSDFIERWAEVQAGGYTRIDFDQKQIGVNAKHVQDIIPDAVHTDDKGMLSLAYGQAATVATVELAKRCVQLEDLLRSALERIEQLEQKAGI